MIKSTLDNDNAISIRCNLSRTSVEECKKLLEEEGVTVKNNPYLEEALFISGMDYLGALKSFQDGLFMVQDPSSMLVAKIAAPQKNDYCIDVCAAPGGKSLHIADLLCSTGMVEARDVSDYKVSLIQSNIARSGFTNIRAVVKDGFQGDPENENIADLVIADLPCSGLGVLGKKSDIKYHMTPEKQKELIKVQRCLLENAVKLVRPGGTFVFSTCTTNREENYENYKWLSDNFPLKALDISGLIPEELSSDTAKNGYLQLLPGINPTDGFFISKFQKTV